MTGNEDDIAASLPVPPRPAPARRSAAIERALQRFDGTEPDVSPGPRRAAWSTSAWSLAGRRYAGALATAALIALIGVPAAWNSFRPPSDSAAEETPVPDRPRQGSAARTPASVAQSEAPAALERNAAAEIRGSVESRAAAADTPPPASTGNSVTAAAAPQPVADEATPTPPAPPSAASGMLTRDRSEFAEQSEATELVVTGSRVARAAPRAPAVEGYNGRPAGLLGFTAGPGEGRRGDWNACTVDDPNRSLAACRTHPDLDSKAAAQVADGLTRAWDGEIGPAISAFDRAVAIAPKSGSAYLNRGLAYRRSGNLDRALADLNRAVRLAPRSARAYYSRSLVYRQIGATGRALADEKRAAALDPHYADLLK